MAFLREFRLANRYISYHALLLLRFYLAQFYYLGLVRLRYEPISNSVHLTHYSVIISRMLSLPFVYFFSLALMHPYKLLIHLQPFLFAWCLLLQPRHVYDRRIRLINRLLQLAPQLYRRSRRKLELSWLLVLQLLLKLLTFKLLLIPLQSTNKGLEMQLLLFLAFVLPVSLAMWLMDISMHLVSIVLTVLSKSFDLLNAEIRSVSDTIMAEILKADHRRVRHLQRRLSTLQRLYVDYARLTQQLLNCLAPQLFLIMVYNLSMVYSISSTSTNPWPRVAKIVLIVYGLLVLFHSLDTLVTASGTPQDTSWLHVARQLEFEEVLFSHGWLELRRLRWSNQIGDTCGQSLRRSLLLPRLQVLGLLTPNRQLFFRIGFAYCWYLHLYFMWKRVLPVAEKEIFLITELNLQHVPKH